MNRRAFTLVELLVVILIVAVLIAMILPALAQTRRAARDVECTQNLKTLGTSIVAWTDERNAFPPDDLEALDIPFKVFRCRGDSRSFTGQWSYNYDAPNYFVDFRTTPHPPIPSAVALRTYFRHNDQLPLFVERWWENHGRHRNQIDFGLVLSRRTRPS